jgi:hypothetical protein
LDIAVELERIVLEDEYFIQRKLYPNVRLLFWDHLSSHGIQAGDVYSAVRNPSHGRLVGAMAGDADGSR